MLSAWFLFDNCAEFCENLLEQAGPRFAGPIAILRNWTYCLFYVMAELWGSVVVSVLFWGFANQVCGSQQDALFMCWRSDGTLAVQHASSISGHALPAVINQHLMLSPCAVFGFQVA